MPTKNHYLTAVALLRASGTAAETIALTRVVEARSAGNEVDTATWTGVIQALRQLRLAGLKHRLH